MTVFHSTEPLYKVAIHEQVLIAVGTNTRSNKREDGSTKLWLTTHEDDDPKRRTLRQQSQQRMQQSQYIQKYAF